MFYIYIIQSRGDGGYYRGFSTDPAARLVCHNAGASEYTRAKIPWDLVFVEVLSTKRDALIREKVIKKYSREQVEPLIRSPRNMVGRFIRASG